MHLFICGQILAWHKNMGTNRSHAPTPPYVPAPRVVEGVHVRTQQASLSDAVSMGKAGTLRKWRVRASQRTPAPQDPSPPFPTAARVSSCSLVKAVVSPVVLFGCEGGPWALKNWCFWTVVLEKTLESSLDSKEIQSDHPKGDWFWILTGRTNAEAPILWPPDAKNWLIGKDPSAGKDWRQEEKGTTEDEMAGWHHRLDGHEFEQALGDGERQGSLACCRPWGHKELDMTERLNWAELTATPAVFINCSSLYPTFGL